MLYFVLELLAKYQFLLFIFVSNLRNEQLVVSFARELEQHRKGLPQRDHNHQAIRLTRTPLDHSFQLVKEADRVDKQCPVDAVTVLIGKTPTREVVSVDLVPSDGDFLFWLEDH